MAGMGKMVVQVSPEVVVKLSPEVVVLLRLIADAIAPEPCGPSIGDTKRLVESDQRDHDPHLTWRAGAATTWLVTGGVPVASVVLPDVDATSAPRRRGWWEDSVPGID